MVSTHSFIDKYFRDQVDYPNDVADVILPPGVYYNYIANTFLDGFINYVQINSAWLISRYEKWHGVDDVPHRTIQVMDPPRSYKWKEMSADKDARFKMLTEKGAMCNSQLRDFGDDVLILATSEAKQYFYLFWFDCDVSDCNIGRFKTEGLDKANVVNDFDDWCRELDMGYIQPSEDNRQIPLHYFSGWIGY